MSWVRLGLDSYQFVSGLAAIGWMVALVLAYALESTKRGRK